MHGPLGIVFVRAVGTKDGEHAVTGVLQHPALVRLDDRREALERAVHDQVNVFGIEVLAQVGGADDIHEQHGRLFQLLAGHRWLCRRARQGVQLGAQRRNGHVHHRVTQNRPLPLDGGDAGVDVLVLCHDAIMHAARPSSCTDLCSSLLGGSEGVLAVEAPHE